MADDFRGRGWRFPILPDETGGFPYAEGDESVEQSLRVLLMTGHGERVMRPRFGTKASRLVFAPAGLQNLRLLETTVREAIRDWEPRVDVLDVRAEAAADDETRVTLSLSYRVRRTNTRQNLVFPYYLGTVAAAERA